MALAAPLLNSTRRDAERLIRRGFAVRPIKPGEKVPHGGKWSTASAAADDFQPGDSVCILTGWPSDGGKPGHSLICVDLDSAEAVGLADQYLPPTPLMDGRPGKPNSHRYFLVPAGSIPAEYTGPGRDSDSFKAATERGVHPGPRKVAFRHRTETPASGKGNATVVEMLGSGQQVNCPPSVHPSGERRDWTDPDAEPADIDFMELHAAVTMLAEACGGREAGKPDPKSKKPGATVAGDNSPLPPQPGDRGPLTPPAAKLPPVPDRVRMAAKYLQAIPDAHLSRSGQSGHNKLFRVCRILVNDFALPEPDARGLLDTYNARLEKLADTWSAAELAKKLADAVAAGPDERFGGKLPTAAPKEWDDPQRLADEFLSGGSVLVAIKGTPFLYADGKAYSSLSEAALTATVRQHCQTRAEAKHRRQQRQWAVNDAELATRAKELPGRLVRDDVPAAERTKQFKQLDTDQKQHAKERGKVATAPKVSPQLVAAAEQAIVCDKRVWLPDRQRSHVWLPGHAGPAHVAVVNNGILDLDTLELRPHSPAFFSLTNFPVDYREGAECPNWTRFLERVLPDPELRALLQTVVGVTLDLRLLWEHFAVLIGPGRNGKGTVLRMIGFLLGQDNCAAVTLNSLAENKHAKWGLYGKAVNVVGDQPKFDSTDEGVIKELTGGDLTEFNQKFRDSLFDVSTAKFVVSCNTIPTFADKTQALWDRFTPIPFDIIIPSGERNGQLKTLDYWRDELPGVLNWALAGRRYYVTRRTNPASGASDALRKRHRRDSDPFREFLETHYRFTGGAEYVTTQDVRGGWDKYKSENNVKFDHMTSRTLNGRVKLVFPDLSEPGQKSFPVAPFNRDIWRGLTVVADAPPPS